MASEAFFRLNGREYPAPTEFTLGEMADMERLFGIDFADPNRSRVSMVAATLFIAVRRVDESVTVDDIRALAPQEFETVRGDARPPDGTSGSEPPASTAPTSASSSSGSEGSETGRNGSGDPISATSTASDLETSLI